MSLGFHRTSWQLAALAHLLALIPVVRAQRLAAAGLELPALAANSYVCCTAVNPSNEYRLVQYQLNSNTLKKYPPYGIGGYMAFFYLNLYQNKNGGVSQIGPLVAAANAQGMRVWLADDFGYPSGSAGGRVVAQNPDYEVRGLTMLAAQGSGQQAVTVTISPDMESAVTAVIYPLTNGALNLAQGHVLPVTADQVQAVGLAGAWKLCLFGTQIRSTNTQAQSTMAQFGTTGRYPDLLNSNAVASFIANMHAPILAQIADPSARVEGFYCNEPNLMQLHWVPSPDAPHACVSWSADLPARFHQMHGYELEPVLAALYEGGDTQSRRVRLHFHQTVADLFSRNFAGQIREWCNARGIHSSGHFLLDEYISMHVACYGDYLKFLAEFDVPAFDIGIPNPENFRTFPYQMARYVSSVSTWKQRETTICLLDPIIQGGGLGRLSPATPLLRNAANMACFNGANTVSSYLPLDTNSNGTATGYTTNDYRAFNEYVGRACTVLRGAKRETSVALYYPIAMFQADYRPSNKFWPQIVPSYAARQQAWNGVEQALLAADLDYEIVHPDAVQAAGVQGGVMKIGFGSYRYLIMPQVEIIPLSALQKIQDFEAGGGTVLWVDQKPQMGVYLAEDAEVIQRVSGYTTVSAGQLAGLITAPYGSRFRLAFTPGTHSLYAARFYRSNGCAIYYLVNREETNLTVQITSEINEAADLYNPFDGSTNRVTLPAQTFIPALGSLLVFPVIAPLAVPVAGGNFSFESVVTNAYSVSGWNTLPQPGAWVGGGSPFDTFSPQSGVHFYDVPAGTNCCYLVQSGPISQDLQTEVGAGTRVTLTFCQGRANSYLGTNSSTLTATLFVGGQSWSTNFSDAAMVQGSWRTNSFAIISTETGNLKIAFRSSSGKAFMDDVRLSLTALSPKISIGLAGSSLVLSWELAAGAYQLMGADNLVPPVAWTPVAASLQTNAHGIWAAMPLGPAAHFFCLGSP